MIDANSQFFAILTNVGMAKQANADALGIPWKLTEMGVGDANLTDPIPSATQTQLIREWRRRPLNQLKIDPVNPAVIIAEQVIPADEGGFWIREIGLYDADGDLVAVANCAPSFKPVLSQGSGRTQVVRMNFIVSSTGNITLKIDPAVVLATREYVDTRIMEELYKLDSKQSVRVATTANIALAGLQVIDGVTLLAGDRVLVKNQTVAKDNGIYIAGAPAWVRALDADTNAEVTSALLVSVEQGTTQADTRWQLITDGVIVLGTTALTFQNVTQGFAPINSPALLGTPTAPTAIQFDSSKLLATTEFVRRAQGNFAAQTSLTLPATITPEMAGTRIVLSGTGTLTLPAFSSCPVGSKFYIHSTSPADVTAVRQGADVIVAFSKTLTSFTIQTVSNAVLATGNAQFVLEEGLSILKYSNEFASSLPGPNCYQRLTGGDIEQWGVYLAAPSGADVVVTLPVAMLAAPTHIELTFADFYNSIAVGQAPVLQARNSTLGTITVRNLYGSAASFFWRVRGRA
ncbi:phage tail protein [Pseudomonas sp. PS02303]|uniref:phage tail protein n=1 Tax=Pseudomonas sp. PS02303 TaxID=2991429 RepID=UPI00249CBF11|nr:phage tail protein [Pseudomonas sp. PS02303]